MRGSGAGTDASAASGIGTEQGEVALRKVVAAEKSLVYTGQKRSVHGEEGESRATRMNVSRFTSGRMLLEWDQGAGSTHRWAYRSRFTWLDDPDLLLRNYTVSLDAEASPPVAGRETRRLWIRGVRGGRPSVELLVDHEKWLVLSEEIRDFDGRPWLTTIFESIEYREPDVRDDQSTTEALPDPRADVTRLPPLPLALTQVPAGFVRVGGINGVDGLQREDWSDGLAAFSVLESPAESAADPGRVTKEGELHRRQRKGNASVSGVFGKISVNVVGNVPAEELESIVRGLGPSR